MRLKKRILDTDRLRALPPTGFSWIDRRFVREYARSLSRDSVLLYFFLAAVSDKHGLSYYGDPALSRCLGISETAVYAARNELQHRSLIRYEAPLYQVLSIPEPEESGAVIRSLIRRLSGEEARS